jgi:general secretion pathway protein D
MARVGTRHTRGHGARVLLVVAIAAGVVACSTGRVFQQGNQAAMRNDWDLAVTYYERAVKADPNRADYKMALDRAQMSASQLHFEKARGYEGRDQLDLALVEYRRVVEYHASNQEARARIQVLEQTIRDRIEAARPRPPVEGMRQKARQQMEEPALNPASREPVVLKFNNRQIQEVLDFLGTTTGINIAYDQAFPKTTTVSVDIDGITLEQALHQILTVNQAYYKVINPRSIVIIADTPTKRAAYDEQALQTFYLSSADPADMEQLLTKVMSTQQGVRPTFASNKASNSITVRGTMPMLQMVERVIAMNDKPRAEISVDVEILEVNRGNAKQYGLDLSAWSVGLAFSPETRPGGTGGTTDTPANSQFNLNTVSAGVSTADFYAAVPTAIIRFLEQDTETKVIAKPNLRGSEGEKLSLKLGEELPVPSTTFYSPYGGSGGVATAPLTSFTYKNVGVNLDLEPRVTFDGDIIMKLTLEISAKGPDQNVAGQNLPSFFSRKVETRIRLRDGESNLLAGLLRENERKTLKGVPGISHVPILRDLFASNDKEITQTDIVMLLTPHILRTHEMSQKDFSPIYIGTQQNIGLAGPPPLIQPPGEAGAQAAPPPAQAGAQLVTQARPGAPVVAGEAASGTKPAATVQPPPTTPVPGQLPPARPAPPSGGQPAAPADAPVTPAAAVPADQTPVVPGAVGGADVAQTLRIALTPPAVPMAVAGPAATVPISVFGASRVSTVTLSLRFDPRVLRPRLVQEGLFMASGGGTVTFAQQVDATAGRIDITLSRTADTTGVSGDGLLASVVFDAVGSGVSALSLGGVVTNPAGLPMPVQFGQTSVTVK